ncbi:ubiquitin-conjugating enzyme E2 [Sarcoptes scabiei]|nr:ubiquitin-conjugating enzyme E2 [Sarcoptes scabiei]
MVKLKETIIFIWHRHRVNFLALLFMIFGLTFNALMISLTHERVPIHLKALPDVGFDLLFLHVNAIAFCELYITLQNICFFIGLLFHPGREKIFRRFTAITGIAYIFRSICYLSTVLPSSATFNCEPKFETNITMGEFIIKILERTFKFILTFGFATQKKVSLCGDQIYSGHTLMIVIGKVISLIIMFQLKSRIH